MAAVADLDINELCERAQVTPRTVHFYVQQGLLPPAGSAGPGARYSEGHVSRIRLIRLLQKQHLPLAEIAKRIRGLSDRQVDGLLAETTTQRRAESKGSALEYIRGVLAEPRARLTMTSRVSVGESFHMASMKPSIAASVGAPEMLEAGVGATPPPAPSRSQWERYTLVDGMELHVRRPLSRIEQKQLEKLMAAARTIFGDEEGER
jgi:DNA-binding transcriptional MerR regulator